MKKLKKVALVKTSLFFSYWMVFHFGVTFTTLSQGCTDPLATNFDASALINDGSCVYPPTAILPMISWDLPTSLQETSGLLEWNNRFWTHNDNSDLQLYGIDTSSVANPQIIGLQNVANYDWEEIAQDSSHIYLGDFGNNAAGNRMDLKIYKVLKSSLITTSQVVDTIAFSYEDQVDFTPAGSNNTDFDCEAFIVTADSIYLFTKQWVSHKTTVYSLPKTPGNYFAQKKQVFNVDGLITGASYIQPENIVLLSGYSQYLQPFVWLLYDFQGTDFFGANKRKVAINLPFHQIESISTQNGLDVFMTNERFQQSTLVIDQQLHQFDFADLMNPYLTAQLNDYLEEPTMFIFPNPSFTDELNVSVEPTHFPLLLSIYDQSGRQVFKCMVSNLTESAIPVQVENGIYYVELTTNKGNSNVFKWLKF